MQSELINRLMAKLPSDRPASAIVVERQLMQWLHPVGPDTQLETVPEAIPYPASRRMLDAIDFLNEPLAPVPSKKEWLARPIPFAVEMSKAKRGWWLDALAIVLLTAGAVGLYLWWKASNTGSPAPAAAITVHR